MRIGKSKARYLIKINKIEQISEVYQFAQSKKLPVIILGEGSNSIATDDDVNAIVVINQLKGIKQSGDLFTAHSGEMLDDFVAKTTVANYSGIECLSGVPGTVGAVPIQNVGAYGQDISQVLTKLTVFDSFKNQFVEFDNQACEFSYRDSIFKKTDKNRYFIIKITVKLAQTKLQPPFYNSLQAYIDQNELTDFSPTKLRQYIKIVRDGKIPDYHQFPSSGSFFQNSFVSKQHLHDLIKQYGDVPHSIDNNKIKIPTAWLIDRAGLKGRNFNGFYINPKSPLILINQSAESFADLQKAVATIKKTIKQKFKIELKPEPIVIKV